MHEVVKVKFSPTVCEGSDVNYPVGIFEEFKKLVLNGIRKQDLLTYGYHLSLIHPIGDL